jgi:2,4-dienoyl-CoA reductase-like NADH-dependent reductase (Old Yellow Enzyme family)/thioredoxin reductase
VLERLFSPLRLGPVELANRIVSTAHQTTLVHDHLPTDDFVAYHEARAKGGAGLIVLEATAVHESGRLTQHTLAGYRDEIAAGYRRVCAAVQPHGTKLFVQLFHGGRELIASPPRPAALAPSAIPSARFKVEPRALRESEIEAIVAGYARSAELAVEGGLDGVEISAAHNYLAAQFFTPELNRRTDRWAEGERFLLAVLEAVRERARGVALGVRLSADSKPARRLASRLAAQLDFLSVALGESSTYRGSTGIVPPPPIVENAIAAAGLEFRPAGIPLIATSRVVDPLEAERLIEEGLTDAVGMTRALIADPELPRKARAGRADEVLRCLGCNACIAHYHAGTPIACAQNPRTGRELTFPTPARARKRLRVAVVGAGPAGLAAAASAGASGHEVVLFERAGRIGGQIALAGRAPGHAELFRSLRSNYERLLAAGGIDVRLETEVDEAAIAELEPSTVVVATGARPFEPPLPLDGAEVLQAWDVLGGNVPAGVRAVVADWGGDPSGLDAAEVLHAAGNEVTIAVASASVGEAMHQYQRNLYLARLYRGGVHIEHHLELRGAVRGEAFFRNVFAPELEAALPADLLVLALGRVPEDRVAEKLRERGLTVEEVGDCRSPRSLEEAIFEGTLAGALLERR